MSCFPRRRWIAIGAFLLLIPLFARGQVTESPLVQQPRVSPLRAMPSELISAAELLPAPTVLSVAFDARLTGTAFPMLSRRQIFCRPTSLT